MLEPGPFGFVRGWPTVVPGDQPAAGAEFFLTNPGRFGWLLRALSFRFVASAAVANRFLSVEYDLGATGTMFVCHPAEAAQAAGSTVAYSFQADRGEGSGVVNSKAALPLLPHLFEPGQRLAIRVANIDVGDQLDRVQMLFDVYPTGPEGGGQAMLDRFARAGN